jgi:hypothetical protein
MQMAVYSEQVPHDERGEPNYKELLDWWQSWPTAKPELLDFWSRGAYVQRCLHRKRHPRTSVTVAAKYIDELEHAIKRLVLLGVEIEFVWTGEISPPIFNMVPLDIDYEGAGGWGYDVASGSRFKSDRRTKKEWAPALGWAQMVPETVTDFIAGDCQQLFSDGRLFLAPAELIGLSNNMNRGPSKKYEQFTGSKTAFELSRSIQLLEELELPFLDGMSTKDAISFCEDHPDELVRLRSHMQDLLADNETLDRPLRELKDSVRELRHSAKHSRLRNTVVSIGGALGAFNFGIASGLASQAIGAGFVAHAALQWWCEKSITQSQIRNHKSWPVWKLAKGKPRGQADWEKMRPMRIDPEQRPGKNVLWHWLAPPEAGWTIPSAFIPNLR